MLMQLHDWLSVGASSTVIVVGLTWLVTRTRAGTDSEQVSAARLTDGTRSASVHVMNGLINEMTRAFSEVVQTTTAVEALIDGPAGVSVRAENAIDRLEAAIEKGTIDLKVLQEDLAKALVVYRHYHGRAQSLRYVILPSLHAMGDQIETIHLLNKTSDEIKVAAKQIRRGGAHLLREMLDLIKVLEVEPEPKDWTQDSYGLLRDTYDPKVFSILTDPEYVGWTSSFTAAEDREVFKAIVSMPRPVTLDDEQKRIMNHAVLSLYSAARMRPNRLLAQILGSISLDLLEARRDCKAFLICLCAISCKLQQRDNGASAGQIFDELSGTELLNARVAVF